MKIYITPQQYPLLHKCIKQVDPKAPDKIIIDKHPRVLAKFENKLRDLTTDDFVTFSQANGSEEFDKLVEHDEALRNIDRFLTCIQYAHEGEKGEGCHCDSDDDE